MKYFVVVVLLAVVMAADASVSKSCDVLESPAMAVTYKENELNVAPEVHGALENLTAGSIGKSSLIAKTTHIRGPTPEVVHVQDVFFRSATYKITAIRVKHVGSAQGSLSSIKSGGVGSNSVTIRLQSACGKGYHYTIKVYGRPVN